MAARIAGRHARLKLGTNDVATPAVIAGVKSWGWDATADQIDATAQGDTTKVYVLGLPGATGDFELYLEEGQAALTLIMAAATDGLPRTIELIPNIHEPTLGYEGTVTISGALKTDVGGVVTVSGKWQAATPLTAL